MSRASCGRLLVVLVVVGAVLASASVASAATLTACVKKSTGEMRLRQGKAAKKKCPKGWKKVRWNVRGPAGTPGVNGTNGTNGAAGQSGLVNVKDATGAIVGQLLTVLPEGGAHFLVLRDGGVWPYLGSGQLDPFFTPPPDYATSDCTGTAYLSVPNAFTTPTWVALIGGTFRVVDRTLISGVFGTARAWKGTASVQSVASTQLYRFDNSGNCETDGGPVTGDLVALEEIQAPPDFTGPLTLG